MSDEILNFDEHRRRREENASTVRCARCGKWIAATALRCPECGVHFQGEAQYFTHPAARDQTIAVPTWLVFVVLFLGAAIIISLFSMK